MGGAQQTDRVDAQRQAAAEIEIKSLLAVSPYADAPIFAVSVLQR